MANVTLTVNKPIEWIWIYCNEWKESKIAVLLAG